MFGGGALTLPVPLWPSWNDFVTVFFLLVLPQILLTFANSMVSCYHVSRDYFGARTGRATVFTGNIAVGFTVGMAEAMRSEGCKKTPRAMISRGVVGIRRETLIVNLPGSPKGARESSRSSCRCCLTFWRSSRATLRSAREGVIVLPSAGR